MLKNQKQTPDILWPELVEGVLVKRYKRFLADVDLADGGRVTAHCPNSGSMKGCAEPGRPVWLSRHDNPKRKLPYTWELIGMPTSLVGVNTLVPNRLVKLAAESGRIPGVPVYETVRPEVKVGEHTRLDLMLENGPLENGRKDRCFIEVKNCTLVEDGAARFPDAVTTRGRKHLTVLSDLKKQGDRAIIFFLIQRCDADVFSPADDIDADYGRMLRKVVSLGVEVRAMDVRLDATGISLNRELPVRL